MARTYVLAAALLGLGASLATPAAVAEAPKLIRQVPPEYPRGAERRGIEGFVVVSFGVDAAGKVTAVQVLEAEPAGVFDSSVERALSQWKFEDGKPVDSVQVKLEFKL